MQRHRIVGLTASAGLAAMLLLSGPNGSARAVAQEGLPVADISREDPVDFERELLPVLRKKCLACHNATDAESDLVLESPESILAGGASGEIVVPGNADESYLMSIVRHLDEPIMPPEDNDVGAENLSPEELALLQQWINEGAVGSLAGATQIEWQPLPPGVNPVYSARLSGDGQWLAASRANQIFLHHVSGRRQLGRLTDPELAAESGRQGIAHRDLVQALAFDASGERVASGGFRTIKIWQRDRSQQLDEIVSGLATSIRGLDVSPDGSWAAGGTDDGRIVLFDLNQRRLQRVWNAHDDRVTGVRFAADGQSVYSVSADSWIRRWRTDGTAWGEGVKAVTPLSSLALYGQDRWLLAAGDDQVVRIWDRAVILPDEITPPEPDAAEDEAESEVAETPDGETPESADEEEPESDVEQAEEPEPVMPEPVRQLSGHGGPVVAMAVIGDGPLLVTASRDGTARLWNGDNGGQVRSFGHGAPVIGLAVRPDGKRIVTVGENQVARLFNADNGQVVTEWKGDYRLQLQVTELARRETLAGRLVELAKTDLTAAQQRKESEDQNLATNQEALTKAEEELQTKVTALEQATTAQTEAETALATAQEALAAAQTALQTAETALTQATEAVQAAEKGVAAATETRTAAAAALDAAKAALQQATESLAADPENEEKQQAVESAQAAVTAAETRLNEAMEAMAAAETVLQQRREAAEAAQTAKDEAAAKVPEAEANVNTATEAVNQAKAAMQTAQEEKNVAERNRDGAQRATDRARQTAEAAAATVTRSEEIVQEEEAARVTAQEAVAEAQAAVTSSETAWMSAGFSGDGTTIALAGPNQRLFLMDGETGAPLDSLGLGSSPITTVRFTDSQYLLTADERGRVVRWDSVPAWRLERTIGSPDDGSILVDRVTALDFSPDGTLLAAGSGEPSRNGQVKVFQVDSGEVVLDIPDAHSDSVFSARFSPRGNFLATCGADRFVKIFSMEDGSVVRALEGHTHHVLGVSWSSDERMLASSGADAVVKIWNARTGDQLRTIQGFSKEVTGVDFVGDSSNVAVSCADRNVYVKRTDNGGNVRTYGGFSDFVYCVDTAPDGKILVAGGYDSVIRVWQDNGQEIVRFEPPEE